MKYIKYLAYGSNLNEQQMAQRCPNSKKVGTGVISDMKLLFKGVTGASYLDIVPSEGDQVPVGVWAISEEDLGNLDRYEGYPNMYKRKVIPYCDEKGVIQHGLVYMMTDKRPNTAIPSAYYVAVCRSGYKSFGFDSKYLLKALSDSKPL